MGLDQIFQQWELELALFISTRPTNDEFWCYWSEREDAIETLIKPEDEAFVESAFERLLAIADAHGYVRLPRIGRRSAAFASST